MFLIAKPKVHSLTGRITRPWLQAAFKAVQRNRGKAGIDRVSIKMFEANLAENLQALERDLKDGSFDNLPHAVLMEAGAAQLADGNILHLVQKSLRSDVMEEGAFKPTTMGTPQGGVISPLQANVVLNFLDWRLHEHGYRFVRYADDFVVLTQTRAQAAKALTLGRLR